MLILGINAYHGDVSAALVHDGRLIAAVEEERFRRVKHWAGFPEQAMRSCLAMAGAAPDDIDAFAISRDPRANRLQKAWYVLRKRPSPALLADRARNQRRIDAVSQTIGETLGLDERRVSARLHWIEHHPAHLASAYFVSPFDEAAVCAIDGFGDFVSTSLARGRGGCLDVRERVLFPHSLGMLYLAVTQYLGFPNYGDEFKVMGLAPYGEPAFVPQLRQLLRLSPDGLFELDLAYFRHASEGVAMTWDDGSPTIGPVFTSRLEALLGPTRRSDEAVTARHEAIAASLQQVYEEAAFHVLRHAQRTIGSTRLCLAGGCAMNSVANGKIAANTDFSEVYIQPASGDNGTALGAAFYAWQRLAGAAGAAHRQPKRFVMSHSYWGPSFSDDDIAAAIETRRDDLEALGCAHHHDADQDAICRATAAQLADGRVVGWFQGRMEWGARALGNRSILADPRRADMRDIINVKIKFREKFRPFAPSALIEYASDYFEHVTPDPFMIKVVPVRPDRRAVIPAVTHVDGSGRLHTVDRQANPIYWSLIDHFRQLTGVPLILNTSFNENEPIVLKPAEALDCFLRTDMDLLVMGGHVIAKAAGAENRHA